MEDDRDRRHQRGREEHHEQPIRGIDEARDVNRSGQRARNLGEARNRAPHELGDFAGRDGHAQRQDQDVRRIATPADQRSNRRSFEYQAQHGGGGERDGQRERKPEPAGEIDREIGAEHVEDAVRRVDDALEAEDDREARREQNVDGARREAIQKLQEDGHATPCRRRDSGRAGLDCF